MPKLSTTLARKFTPTFCGVCAIFCGWNLTLLERAHGESPPLSEEESAIVVDPKLEALTFFQKTWTCLDDSDPPALEEGAAASSYRWDMVRELNDLWFFAIRYQPPKAVASLETWGYNTVIQKYGRTIIGNDGTFANFLSDGWQDNTMVWQGSSTNMVSQSAGKHQITITKTSDSRFTEVEKASTGENEWTIISSKTCTLPEST